MKDSYHKNSNGEEVKFDSNPDNDYSDGYNAGRRYNKPRRYGWLLLLLIGLALLSILLRGHYMQPKHVSNPTSTPTYSGEPAPNSPYKTLPDTGASN